MNQEQMDTSLQGLTKKVLQTLDLPEGGFKEKLTSLSPTENMIRAAILFKLSEGNKVNVADLTTIEKQVGVDMQSILQRFSELDLVHWDKKSGNVTVAYPFSGTPTSHRVTLSGKAPAYAMCAIDALGIPSMFKSDSLIKSECAYCGKEININVKDNVPVSNPETVVVGVGTVTEMNSCSTTSCGPDPNAPVSTSCCPAIQFYCSEEHWVQANEKNSTKARHKLTLMEALKVGAGLFGGALEGFKNEMTVQTEANRIILESDRFTCKGCVDRAIDEVKQVPGVLGNIVVEGSKFIVPIALSTDKSIVVKTVQEGLESDPYYPFPIIVKYL